MILAVLEENLINTKPTDFLPYVLNGPIYLFLFEILSMSVEVDILHNTGMLQDLLQICKIY